MSQYTDNRAIMAYLHEKLAKEIIANNYHPQPGNCLKQLVEWLKELRAIQEIIKPKPPELQKEFDEVWNNPVLDRNRP